MKISFILPAYNVEAYLERCVSTLYMQDIPAEDFEVLIINDGSTDKTLEVAQAIAKKHTNVHVFSQANAGAAVARNVGLDHAQGKYVCFVDTDDFLIPYTLKSILELVEENNLDACSYRLFSEHTYEIAPYVPKVPKHKVLTGEQALMLGEGTSLCIVLYSRDCIERNHLRLKVNGMGEDVEFNMRFYSVAQRVYATLNLCYYYVYNKQSQTKSDSFEKFFSHLKDVAIVAQSFMEHASQPNISSTLKEYFLRRRASATIGLIQLISNNRKTLSLEQKQELLHMMEERQLYPIRHRTLSTKSNILRLLLNQRWILNKRIGL